MERAKVGEVFHYYTKIGVAAIRLTDGELAVGDTIQIQGPSTDLTERVETMQIEHADVPRAGKGQEVGVRVKERVRERDLVYKVTAP
jgi:putative protease